MQKYYFLNAKKNPIRFNSITTYPTATFRQQSNYIKQYANEPIIQSQRVLSVSANRVRFNVPSQNQSDAVALLLFYYKKCICKMSIIIYVFTFKQFKGFFYFQSFTFNTSQLNPAKKKSTNRNRFFFTAKCYSNKKGNKPIALIYIYLKNDFFVVKIRVSFSTF